MRGGEGYLGEDYGAGKPCGQHTLTSPPVVGDVLQHGDRDAEKGDEQVAEGQRADEDVGDGAHSLAAGHHVEHQSVAEERQREEETARQCQGHLGSRGQLRGVDERAQAVAGDELLSRQVVVPQQPGELLGGDVERLHSAPRRLSPSASPSSARLAPKPGARGSSGCSPLPRAGE